MPMRRSRVLDRLRAGRPAFCYKTNLSDARSIEIAALAGGIDCVWCDLEHTANDWSVVERDVWAAKSRDVDLVVRVERGSYSDYIKPFELDAAGIIVPHILGVADAEQVVQMCRFRPVGSRAIDAGNADGQYFTVDMSDYAQHANAERFVALQIEDEAALQQVDEIAAIPGFDMLFFGPGDYGHSVGLLGQWNHPRLLAAQERVARAAADHGKWAATVGSPESLERLLDIGYRFVNLGVDILAIGSDCRRCVEAAESVAGARSWS